MKRKIFATFIAAVTAILCAFGLSACGGDNGGDPKPALVKAYRNYRQTQNMTVTVTDDRTVKHGNDYSATVKIDYSHKAAYSENTHIFPVFPGHAETVRQINKRYYEIDGNKPAFTIYSMDYVLEEETVPDKWGKIDRSDLFDDMHTSNFGSQTEFEINLLTNFVDSYIPSHAFGDTCWGESENSVFGYSSLEFLAQSSKESASGYTADVYFCINDGGTYVPYACAVTIKLDGQDRFKSVVLDFGSNGKITGEYVYGTTAVIIPAEVKA